MTTYNYNSYNWSQNAISRYSARPNIFNPIGTAVASSTYFGENLYFKWNERLYDRVYIRNDGMIMFNTSSFNYENGSSSLANANINGIIIANKYTNYTNDATGYMVMDNKIVFYLSFYTQNGVNIKILNVNVTLYFTTHPTKSGCVEIDFGEIPTDYDLYAGKIYLGYSFSSGISSYIISFDPFNNSPTLFINSPRSLVNNDGNTTAYAFKSFNLIPRPYDGTRNFTLFGKRYSDSVLPNGNITQVFVYYSYVSTLEIITSYIGGAGTPSFTLNTIGVCTLTGTTLTILQAGTFGLTASFTQSGSYNSEYITVYVTITRLNPNLIFYQLPSVDFGKTLTLLRNINYSYLGNGNLVILSKTKLLVSDTTLVTGTTITPLEAGVGYISFRLYESNAYNGADVEIYITINPISPNLAFTPPTVYFGTTITLLRNTHYSYLGDGSISFVSSDNAIVRMSGNNIIPQKAGSVTITANMPAFGGYTLDSKTVSVTVIPITPNLNFTLSSVPYGSTLTLTKNTHYTYLGTAIISFTSSDETIVKVSGNTITPLKEGIVTITANIPAFGGYTLDSKTVSITISLLQPTITFLSQSVPFGSTPTLNATSNSVGAFSYKSSDDTIAILLNINKLTFLKIGTVTVTATQAQSGNYASATKVAIFSVFANSLPDFYYRSGNVYSNMLLNDAYLNSINPVTKNLYSRFKASDFNPTTKVWKDSVTGTTVNAVGNVTLVNHSGDKQYRTTKAVQFDPTGYVNFGNQLLPDYTLFYITRYTGTTSGRILNGSVYNWFSGHWGGYSGVEYHNDWLTNPNPQSNSSPSLNLHLNNFFIGSSVAKNYYTNGILRTTNTNVTNLVTYLPPLTINNGLYPESSDCQVLDVLIYNSVLSDLEKKKVEQYLASYYGLLDLSGNLTATYNRALLSAETSLLESTTASPNWIVYPSFNISLTGLTFSMWFKSDGTVNYGRLFDFGNGPESDNIIAFILYGNLGIGVYPTGPNTSNNNQFQLQNVFPNCNDNLWRHFIWTISADGLTWKVYINKVIQATITTATASNYGVGIGGILLNPFHPRDILRTKNYIGKSNWNDPILKGSIDDFKMFNYPLSEPEINQLYTVNTMTTLSVNLEQGSLLVPIVGTSFISSNPLIATVSGTTITLIKAGTTTITSNLHSTANPIQLVLTVTRNGTNYFSGQNDLIEQIDKTTIQSLTIRPTTSSQTLSLLYKQPVYKKNIQVSLEGVSNVGDTTLTFGAPKKNLWVAIGGGTLYTMAYSSDGINWTGISSSIFVQGRGLAWNGRIWVAGGDGAGANTLGYSYDGINWTGLGKTIFNTGCYDFAWNGKVWVAGGGNSGTNTLAYSYDGINWTGRGNQINTFVNSVGYNGKMFIAVGSGTVNMVYSYDGINWITNHTSLFVGCQCVRWNGTLWVAGGNGNITYIAYSEDGINWDPVDNSRTLIGHEYGLIGVAWNGILWVGVGGASGCTNNMVYSYDGMKWSGLGTSIFSNYPYSITWNGEMFMACGTGTNSMAYSYDGLHWVGLGTSIFSNICYAAVNNAAYENSITIKPRLSIAGGRGANTLAYSYDWITWKGLGKKIFNGGCYCIAWNRTIWVAMGYGNIVGEGKTMFAYSYDGINWTANTAYNALFTFGYWVAWNGTMWIAGGGAGTCTLASSTDGKTWTAIQKTTFTDYCIGIVSNGKRWVALGKGTNSIAYSDNGTTWTGIGTSIFSEGLTVAWNGTMFLAAGSGINNMAYSYDGETWIGLGTSVPSSHGIGWNGTMWVVVGVNAGYSYDGKIWYSSPLPSSCGYGMYVNWNGSLWIAATLGATSSKTSTLAYSADGINWTPLGKNTIDSDGVGIGSDWTGESTSIQLYQPHVACGTGNNTLAYSKDGITWTGLGKTIFDIWGSNAVYNGSLWLACGKGTVNSLAYSYDGLNWTGLGNKIFEHCESLLYYNNLWVSGGFGTNTMAYSKDGFNWTGLGNSIFTSAVLTLATNGTIWLAGGYGTNTLAYSYDGLNWTRNPNTPFNQVCCSIVWNGTIWVASGEDPSPIAYSYDGLTWARPTSDLKRGTSLAWNGTVFAVVGYEDVNYRLAYSSDGINWTSTIMSFLGTPRGILWTGHLWIIFVENSPYMKYSFDGKTWINTSSTVFSTGLSGAVGDGRLSDTLNIATDAYYQGGYKTITFSTNQRG